MSTNARPPAQPSPSVPAVCLRQSVLRRKLRAFAGALESLVVPDPDDLAGLLELGDMGALFYRTSLRHSYSAEPGVAVRDHDEENPGKHKIVFRTLGGVETTYCGLAPDLPASSTPAVHAAALADPWDTLRDPNTDPISRTEVLVRLLKSAQRHDALAYLIDQIALPDLEVAWRDALVFAAESTHFPPELRSRVSDALLGIAIDLRSQPEGPDKVVWSALRRGASLLDRERINRLLPFLTPGGSVDTRAVALQCVTRLFEPAPPEHFPQEIADRAAVFADKFLDLDVFTAGESSVIARAAVSALAALGDARLHEAITRILWLARPWLTRRTREELTKLRQAWTNRGVLSNHPAVTNLLLAVTRLS